MTDGGMRFRILGGLEWRSDGTPLTIGRRRERLLLGLLLLDIGRVVPANRLIDLLWDEGRPPASARGSLQVHVSRLRNRFLKAQAGEYGFTLGRSNDGYTVDGDPASVDLHQFRFLLQRAEAAAAPAERLPLLERALDVWGGPVLAGTASDALVRRLGTGFDELHLSALTQRAEARLALGQRGAVLEELARATADHPHHERLAMLRMIALYRADHRGEALEVYNETRSRLAEELGLDPGADLRRIHSMILRADAGLLRAAAGPAAGTGTDTPERAPAASTAPTRPGGRAPGAPGPMPGGRVPCATDGRVSAARSGAVPLAAEAESVQRHSRTGAFIGRTRELAHLSGLLADARGGSGVVMVVGPGGSGKTALALQWCRGATDEFPDGQLFLDLRGHSDRSPMRPTEALSALLRALGVPYQEIPHDAAEMAELYQRTLIDRRVLIVLDNAESADQVRQLLPYEVGCLALVTSRNRLGALIVSHGASMLPLRPLSSPEAMELVRSVIGTCRSAAEPEALAELVALCGHSPLALRIAAANLALHPEGGIAEHVGALRSGNPLESLVVAGDPDSAVRRAFELSYRRLDPEARRAFRLLGLLPRPTTTVAAFAALLGCTVTCAHPLLERLFAEHLVEHDGRTGLRLHDLIWWYARLLAEAEESEGERRAARRALLRWYTASADAAAATLYPQLLRLDVEPLGEGEAPERFDAPQAAADWFDAELGTMAALITAESESSQRPQHAEHAPHSAGMENPERPERRNHSDRSDRSDRPGHSDRPDHRDRPDRPESGAGANARPGTTDLRRGGDGFDDTDVRGGTGGWRGRATYPGPEPCPAVWILPDLLRGYFWLRRNAETWISLATLGLRAAQRAGDLRGQAAAYQGLGLAIFTTGDLELCRTHFLQGLALAREAGWAECESVALSNLAGVCADLGLLSQAAEFYDQAITNDRRLRRTLHQPLQGLSEVLYGMGRLREAERLCRRALALARKISAPDSTARIRSTLAMISLDLGELDRARDLATAAHEGFQAIGNRTGEAESTAALSLIAAERGDGTEALRLGLAAIALSRKSGRPRTRHEALVALGHARYRLGQYTRAYEHFRLAHGIAEEIGYPKGRTIALLGLGICAARACRPLEALRHAGSALSLAQQSQLRLLEGQAQTVIALAQSGRGDRAAAERAARQAEAIYTGTGYRPTHSPYGSPVVVTGPVGRCAS
ncbi:BTAD domain-containing putative transcriptional regulator [Streptomyces sp. NPDC057638]|uniref:BTAD domain-containing putative transcriptional regulator n=1 Tax=Streptomyces sp. NPDC057638 TaxID=3346190 RepID=UPI00369D614F